MGRQGACLVLASVAAKATAATHFLWAGLVFGIILQPFDYVLLLLVVVGFIHLLFHLAHIPGGFVLGAIFAFELLGVPEEQSLAIVASARIANVISIAVIGGIALWDSGIRINSLQASSSAEGPLGRRGTSGPG